MSRSLSWIEPSEVSRRLSRATGHAPDTSDLRTTSVPWPDPPSTESPPARKPRPRPPSILIEPPSEMPAPSVAEPPAPSRSAAVPWPDPPTYAAEDGFAKRLSTFCVWLGRYAAPRGFYIADADGLAIHMENVSETQVVIGVALAQSLRPLRALIGTERFEAATLHLDGGRILHTMWTKTRVGRVAMGIEAQNALHPNQLSDVSRAVRGIFDNEATTS